MNIKKLREQDLDFLIIIHLVNNSSDLRFIYNRICSMYVCNKIVGLLFSFSLIDSHLHRK